MRRIHAVLALVSTCALLFIAGKVTASERVGLYALVERVVLEPEQSPQRIQLWGAFATDRTTATPKKGYMYFMLPPSQQATVRKEWADFKTIAGTGRVVGFGMSFFGSQNQADTYHASLGRVRPASEKPQSPDTYPLNFGLSTVTNQTIIASLKNALKG